MESYIDWRKMLIVDSKTKLPLKNVSLFLTKEELKMLQGYIKFLIEKPPCEHVHFNDYDYIYEIMIASYSEEGPNTFTDEINAMLAKN